MLNQSINRSINQKMPYSIDIGAIANEKTSGFKGSGAGSVVKSAFFVLPR